MFIYILIDSENKVIADFGFIDNEIEDKANIIIVIINGGVA